MSMATEPQEAAKQKGIECPRCACRHFETDRTQPVAAGVRRKRICRNCGTIVWTKETIWTVPPQKDATGASGVGN